MNTNPEDITKKLQQSQGNIILKAGAGTGKTYNLTERVVSLIIDEQCRLDQILAMTFTDYAAAEMRERIYNRISLALQVPNLNRELIDHLQREKREFSKNYISTFHSFCSRVLQYYPDELSAIHVSKMPDGLPNDDFGTQETAQLETGFEILDEYNEAILKQDWRKAFYKLYKDHQGLHHQLRNLRRNDLEKFLESNASSIDDDDLLRLARLTPEAYLDLLREVQKNLQEDIDERFSAVKDLILANPGWFKQELPLEAETFLGGNEILTASFTVRRKFVTKDAKEEVKSVVDPLTKELGKDYKLIPEIQNYLEHTKTGDILTSKESDEYNANHEAYWNIVEMAELSLRWNQFMHFQRMRERKLNFDDVIWLADKLFETNDTVAEQLRNRFRYVLIDEFQDTNQRQWKIVKRLSRWDSGGNVLLVGDMKQAIYRFRGGEVTMMRVAEQEMKSVSADQLNLYELDYSFRSNQTVVDFCNAVFRHCFGDHQDGELFEAEAQNLRLPAPDLAKRSTFPGRISIMGYSENQFDKNEYGALYEDLFKDENEHYLEALRIARFLHEIRKGNQNEAYSAIREKLLRNEKAVGILYKSRKYQHYMERALRLYQLPYTVASGRGFFSNQEIRDCYNLLGFLLDAFDDIALVGVLRSPFVGLSDPGLLAIRNIMDSGSGKYMNFWQTVKNWKEWGKEDLMPPDQLALSEMIPILENLREQSKNVRVSDLLEEANRQTNFLSGFTGQQQPEQNIYKLIEIVRDLEQKEQGNLFEIVEFLRTQIEQDSEEKDAELPDSGAIQIMTVHGSKGLEFPMVILPDLASTSNNGGLQNYVSPSDAYIGGYPLLAYKAENKFSADDDDSVQFVYELLKKQNGKRDLAELKRLFYVALTRAQTHILLSDTASYPKMKNQANSFSGFLNSWLDAEGDRYSDLVNFDLLTRSEFEEIRGVVTGQTPIVVNEQSEVEKSILTSQNLDEAMALASVKSRNVSHHTEEEQPPVDLFSVVDKQWEILPPNVAGTLIHKMLEMEVENSADQLLLLSNSLQKEGFSDESKALERDRNRVLYHARKAKSWLEHQFPAPQQILHETAFECLIDWKGELQYIRGVIDLMIQDQKGDWYLIDFKTNAVRNEKSTELIKSAGYDEQLHMYRKAVEQITNGQIKISESNAILLFTEPEDCLAVSLSDL